jgi:hypothetical protein
MLNAKRLMLNANTRHFKHSAFCVPRSAFGGVLRSALSVPRFAFRVLRY